MNDITKAVFPFADLDLTAAPSWDMQATVDFGRRHPEVGVAFSNNLKNLE